MGVKKINRYHLIQAGVMTGTTKLPSKSQDVSNFDNVGLQFEWSGTPNGTLAILGSIDGVNFRPWTPSPSLTNPAGSASGFITGLNQFPFPYFQVTYTNASSTGVLDVWVFSKDLN